MSKQGIHASNASRLLEHISPEARAEYEREGVLFAVIADGHAVLLRRDVLEELLANALSSGEERVLLVLLHPPDAPVEEEPAVAPILN